MLYRQSVRTMNPIIDGSTVCPTSEVSPTVTFIVQTLADVTLLDKFRSSGASWILRKYELCIHVDNCTRIYEGIQLQYKIQHTGTWLEAAWPPRCLCYRPAVFFRHLRAITLSYCEESFGVLLKKCYYFKYIYLLKNWVRLKFPNLKLLQSCSVCSDIRLCWLFNDGINW